MCPIFRGQPKMTILPYFSWTEEHIFIIIASLKMEIINENMLIKKVDSQTLAHVQKGENERSYAFEWEFFNQQHLFSKIRTTDALISGHYSSSKLI